MTMEVFIIITEIPPHCQIIATILYTPAPITSYKLEMEDEETVSLCTGAKQLLHSHLKNLKYVDPNN